MFNAFITKTLFMLHLISSIQYLTQAVEIRSPPFIYKYYPRYCDIKSCQNQHTMCTYRPLVKRCQPPCKAFMYKDIRRLILKNHNLGRSEAIPEGKLMKIRWNNDLEQMAHQWVGLCYNRTESCLRTRFNERYGQIVHAWSVDSKSYNYTAEIDKYTKELYAGNDIFFNSITKELLIYRGKNVDEVQLIWGKTMFIGCSFLEEPIGDKTMARMVCNYFPAPEIGQPIFSRDRRCPLGSRASKRYLHLCTDEIDEYDDIPPAWYTRVRLYGGKIIYPEARDAANTVKFTTILFAFNNIIIQLFS